MVVTESVLVAQRLESLVPELRVEARVPRAVDVAVCENHISEIWASPRRSQLLTELASDGYWAKHFKDCARPSLGIPSSALPVPLVLKAWSWDSWQAASG